MIPRCNQIGDILTGANGIDDIYTITIHVNCIVTEMVTDTGRIL